RELRGRPQWAVQDVLLRDGRPHWDDCRRGRLAGGAHQGEAGEVAVSKLIVSVPVWRADYMRTFERCAAPALRYATALHNKGVGGRVLFDVDTANAAAARRALSGLGVPDAAHVGVRPIVPAPTYAALQECHADAVRQAAVGERVILLN